MRILHVIDTLCVGGSPTFLKRLTGALAKRGHVQKVICLNQWDEGFVASFHDDVAVTRYGKWQYALGLGLARLVADIHMHKADVVHTVLPYADFMGRIAGKLSGRPVISSIRGHKTPFQFALDRPTAKLATACTVNANCLAAYTSAYEGIPSEKITLIYNGIEPEIYLAADRAATRAALGLPDDALALCCVARLGIEKDHASMLYAFRQLLDQRPEAHLFLAGEGPCREPLELQAENLGMSEAVHFLGNHNDVPGLLAGMDLFVLSSLHEGLPNALLEAMASGLPVIATRVGAIYEVLKNNVTGVLVSPGDTEALAAAMIKLANDPEKMHALGAAGRKLLLESFNMDNMTDKFETLFQGLTPGEKGALAHDSY